MVPKATTIYSSEKKIAALKSMARSYRWTIFGSLLLIASMMFAVLDASAATLYDTGEGVSTTYSGGQLQQRSISGLTGTASHFIRYTTCTATGSISLVSGENGVAIYASNFTTLLASAASQVADATECATIGQVVKVDYTLTQSVDLSQVGNITFAGSNSPNTTSRKTTTSVIAGQAYYAGSLHPTEDLAFGFADGPVVITDARENPAATITRPADGADITQDEINAVGANAYYFRVFSNVQSEEFPGEYDATADIEVYENDAATLRCRIYGSSPTVLPDEGNTYLYATEPAWFVVGSKEDGTPCDNFALSAEGESYRIRARWTFAGFEPGEWSEMQPFRVVPFGYVPPLDCADDPSILSLCWLPNTLQFLVKPSPSAVSALFEKLDDFNDRFPFSWFAQTSEAYTTAMEETATDFGQEQPGNPMQGEAPNTAWWFVMIRSMYGDWAAPAAAFFIWSGVVVAITRSAFAMLGISSEDNIEVG